MNADRGKGRGIHNSQVEIFLDVISLGTSLRILGKLFVVAITEGGL